MTLALFFTRSVSLETWLMSGLFDREKLLYEAHLINGNLDKVYWFTYGSNDSKLAKKLSEEGQLHSSIIICEMPWYFNVPIIGTFIYSLFLPLFQYKAIIDSHYLKTNQIDGSWSAVFAKWIFQKKLLLRTGYTQSIFLINANATVVKVFLSKLVERFAYFFCDVAIVASIADRNYIVDKYDLKIEKIEVIPNFVDIEKFKPSGERNNKKNTLVYVGRLTDQKNLFNLIDAADLAKLDLDIIGEGELRGELETFASSKKININFKGLFSNNDLPNLLNQYRYFILPSNYEGMPKTLIEAMACGLVCIGTDIDGINELIEDGVSGFLATQKTSESIFSAINKAVKAQKEQLDLISGNAKKFICEKHSLTTIVLSEKEIFDAKS